MGGRLDWWREVLPRPWFLRTAAVALWVIGAAYVAIVGISCAAEWLGGYPAPGFNRADWFLRGLGWAYIGSLHWVLMLLLESEDQP